MNGSILCVGQKRSTLHMIIVEKVSSQFNISRRLYLQPSSLSLAAISTGLMQIIMRLSFVYSIHDRTEPENRFILMKHMLKSFIVIMFGIYIF